MDLQYYCVNMRGHKETISNSLGTTWEIPPYYSVKNASLSNSSGEILASYNDNPLFLNAYSHSITVSATLDELKEYIIFDKDRPNEYVFSFRRQYRHWEKGWGISLPQPYRFHQ